MSIWNSLLSGLNGFSSYGELGALGDISFSVSSWNRIHTFEDFSRSAKSRTAAHGIVGQKPLTEYIGADLQTISLRIKLHAARGVNPLKEAEKIIAYCEEGTVLTFTVGGKRIGKHRWLIESVTEAVKFYDSGGAILFSELDVSLKEYVLPQLPQGGAVKGGTS